jgi:hypothetical protein
VCSSDLDGKSEENEERKSGEAVSP